MTPMVQDRSDENWRATLDLEAGRRYRFRYLVDGMTWLTDRQADDCMRNTRGSYDSVVDLTESDNAPSL